MLKTLKNPEDWIYHKISKNNIKSFAVILCLSVGRLFIRLSFSLISVHDLMLWKLALNIWSLFKDEGLFSFLIPDIFFTID